MARNKSVSTPLAAPPDVTIDAITKSYEDVVVLDGVSLTAGAGRTTVIMGPSGVGKTTLIRIVLGLLDPDPGTDPGAVTIGGRRVVDASDAELRTIRQGIGTLLGGSSIYDSSVFASMSTWENIRYPLSLRGHDEEWVTSQIWRRLDEFELGNVIHHKPPELSAGTRRRLALARAFVEEPPLLVLDDPGAAMDLANRAAIIESIRRAREHTSATVLLACHDIDMAKKLGDDMIVLLGGRVVAAGPVYELLDGVHDAETFNDRFKVTDAFAVSDARSRSTMGRVQQDESEQGQEHWIVYGTLLVMAVVTLVALVVGFVFLGWDARF